ncbi:MAG: hypothetical protein ACSLFP_17875 [Acidimicrobiales bacterium]
MSPRTASRPIAALLAIALAAGATVAAAPAAGAADCPSPFTSAFRADLARRYPGITVTAAVYDTQSGCWLHLNPNVQVTTASVVKAQILGAVLLRAQREGRGLTSWERSQIAPMIRLSYNPETSALYGHVGGVAGMRASDGPFGATATSHTAAFGLTRSTAIDRTRVSLRLLYGGGGLAQSGRDTAWAYMSNVHPLQSWGISAGVPRGWTVAQKNGFYPSSGIGWRVGSTGFVQRDDGHQGYAITVMTEGGGDQTTNIRLVEEVARRAAETLTVGPGLHRPVDRARCVRLSGGESWASAASRLGLPTSQAARVRDLAGGNPSPLSGQRACSPSIPAEARPAASTVQGSYRPLATDLDCDTADDLLWYAPGPAADTLWRGHPDRRFRASLTSIVGDYVPLAGDYDGDGCGDIFWYGPGLRSDSIWFGGDSLSIRPATVHSTGYVPKVGDFDGDGSDDILWYHPGPGGDYVWYGSTTRGSFSSAPVRVNGAYVPVVGDYQGDGADDVFWYGVGAAPEAMWRGQVGPRRFVDGGAVPVNGRYRPVALDLDGDQADELLWYSPGTAPDFRWDGLPTARQETGLAINGDYWPVAGDLDGDGIDDIAWYAAGGGGEFAWWGRATGGHTSTGLHLR